LLRPDGLTIETATGSVLSVGRWGVGAPQNVVRDAIALRAAGAAGQVAGQTAARRYLIRPHNLGLNTDVRARSTRSLQVRVTDENDRPVPDAPVLFLLGGGGGAGGAGQAGATTLRATTNSNGVASVEYTAPDAPGDRIQIRAQVEGTDAVWQGSLRVLAARPSFWAPQNSVPIFGIVAAGVAAGVIGIINNNDPAPTIPPITQRPGGTVIVP
jgi:hypothetical protein